MNKKHILALTAAAVLMFPIYGCTPAAQRESGFAGNATNTQTGTTNRAQVANTVGYHARPDIANVVMRNVPGVRSAVVLVKDHNAYVAVNRGITGGTGGTTGGYVGGAPGATGRAGTYGYGGNVGGTYSAGPDGSVQTPGQGLYGGTTTNGVTGGYAAGQPGGTTGNRYLGGYRGGTSSIGGNMGTTGGMTGRSGTLGGTTGGTMGAPGYTGGTTGAGGYAGTTGGVTGGTMGGGTTGGTMGMGGTAGTTLTGPGGTGTSGVTTDLRNRITSTVKASDHDIHNVYVSDDPGLLSRFQGFARGATGTVTGAVRTGVNDLGDAIRRIFPGVRP